jgi:hypothetical protein
VAHAQRIEVKDPAGRVVGWLDPADAAAVARYRQQRAGPPRPTYTSEQVRRHLAVLEAEWEKTGEALPPDRAAEILAELAETDPPAGPLWPPPGR